MILQKIGLAMALALAVGHAMAITLDDFSTPQAGIRSPDDGSPATSTVNGRTISALRTSGPAHQDAEVIPGSFSSSTGDGSTGWSQVSWGSAWAGFISNLTSYGALVVNVKTWDHPTNSELSVTLDDGANHATQTIDVTGAGNVVFNLSSASFPGVNLASITDIAVRVTDTADAPGEGDPLDASLALVSLTETPPPPIPVLPPLALLFSAIGLGAVGAWSARRRSSK